MRVIGIRAVLVVIAGGVGKDSRCNRDDSVSVAVGVGREGGGVNGAGDSGPVGE